MVHVFFWPILNGYLQALGMYTVDTLSMLDVWLPIDSISLLKGHVSHGVCWKKWAIPQDQRWFEWENGDKSLGIGNSLSLRQTCLGLNVILRSHACHPLTMHNRRFFVQLFVWHDAGCIMWPAARTDGWVSGSQEQSFGSGGSGHQTRWHWRQERFI